MGLTFGGHVTAAFGVVRHVPARAFELKRWRGHEPMHVSPAFFVGRQRLIGKLLDHFKGFAAAFAFVFVNWQRRTLLRWRLLPTRHVEGSQRRSWFGIALSRAAGNHFV